MTFSPLERLNDEQLAKINAVREITSTLANTIINVVPLGTVRDDCFAALERMLALVEHEVTEKRRPVLTPAIVADACAIIENHDTRVARIYMNAYAGADMLKWAAGNFDPETQMNYLQKGIRGSMWGVQFRIGKGIRDGHIVLIEDGYELDLVEGWTPDATRTFNFGYGVTSGTIPKWAKK